MKYEALKQKAESRGLALHDSVTPDRLAKMNESTVTPLTSAHRDHLDEWDDAWIEQSAVACLSGDLGVGDELVGQLRVDQELGMVLLPSWTVVAVVDGTAESWDGDDRVSRGEGTFVVAV